MQIQRQTKDTPKSNKTNMTFFISEELAKKFRDVADKDMRNYSKVVERYMISYINSQT